MYFTIETHSVLCLLLSYDKFYIHFGGSLEYWINDDNDGGGCGGSDDDDENEL
jgi:hypothetical protein